MVLHVINKVLKLVAKADILSYHGEMTLFALKCRATGLNHQDNDFTYHN